MKNKKGLYLVHKSPDYTAGYYVSKNSSLSAIEVTADIRDAKDFSLVLFRERYRRKASEVYETDFMFKRIITITEWKISVDENIDFGKEEQNKDKIFKVWAYIVAAIIAAGLIHEQGIATAVVLALIIYKLYWKEEKEEE